MRGLWLKGKPRWSIEIIVIAILLLDVLVAFVIGSIADSRILARDFLMYYSLLLEFAFKRPNDVSVRIRLVQRLLVVGM